MRAAQAQSVLEDYVKVIYAHTEWQSEPMTSSALAGRLGLAASSVTEMVKKLAVAGYVVHEPYGAIQLTAAGELLALTMLRRHRLIETWLVMAHGYGWHEVHDEAEILEHALSDRLVESIARQLGDPSRDPHGDPIPSAAGVVQRPQALCLADAPVGHRGSVVRVSDRDPEVLRVLDSHGIVLDAALTVRERSDTGAVRVTGGGEPFVLDSVAAASVWVSRR